MAKVVVLMPVYNGGAFLQQAIQSVLDQSFTDFQLLLIDDASTDNTPQLVESFDDSRINYQRNDRNLGLARTLNLGLKLADCEYLVRMDSDDISLGRRLEWQVRFMESHPELGISGTWLKIFGSSATRGVIRYLDEHGSMEACLLFCTPLAHPTVIIRHAEWMTKKLFYDPDFSRTEDFELWSRAVQRIRFGNLPKVTCLYRRHSESATLANQGQMIGQYEKIVKGQLKRVGIVPVENELRLHVKIGLREKVDSLAELHAAEQWLQYVGKQAVGVGYEKSCVQKAISLVWYRFARNAAWLGRQGEKVCLSSSLLIPESVSLKERALFKAAVLYHSCRGQGQ